jgi:hypothetical protein
MPNRTFIDKQASASLIGEHEAAMRRIDLLHRVRRVLLAVAAVLAAVAAWAALQAPPAPSVPAPQPTVTTPVACPPRPLTTGPAGGYVPTPASADDLEDC